MSDIALIALTAGMLAVGLAVGWWTARNVVPGSEVEGTGAGEEGTASMRRWMRGGVGRQGAMTAAFERMVNDLGAVKVSKSYVDSILASMADALMVIGLDRRIQSANPAALALLGMREEELIGQDLGWVVVGAPTELEELFRQLQSSAAGRAGVPPRMELNYRTRRAELVPVQVTASVLRNPVGILQGVVCVAQDMRERKRAEAELEEAQRRLNIASHRAGMAEIATGVIHNVGNVLNSVNVAASLILERVRLSKGANLAKVVDLLRSNAGDLGRFLTEDPKGVQVLPYLERLTEHLELERTKLVREGEELLASVGHVKEIIAAQQVHARLGGVIEPIDATEVLEDAIRLNAGALKRNGIRVIRRHETVPRVKADRHKLLQILVNLVRNARQACEDGGKGEGLLETEVSVIDSRVRIAVRDNGKGMDPSTLERLFHHGFTTRVEGCGFGLHSAAVAAREMKGTLSGYSAGLGQGALFELTLPLAEDGVETVRKPGTETAPTEEAHAVATA